MSYTVTVTKSSEPHPSGNARDEEIYSQTVEKLDITAVIFAVNQSSLGAAFEAAKHWIEDLLKPKQK